MNDKLVVKTVLVKIPEKRLDMPDHFFEEMKCVNITPLLKNDVVDNLIQDGNNLLTRGCINDLDAAEFALNIANSGRLAKELNDVRLDITKYIREDLEDLKRIFDQNINLIKETEKKLSDHYVKYQEEQAALERKRIAEEQRIQAEKDRIKAEAEAAAMQEETLFDDEIKEASQPRFDYAPEPIIIKPAKVETSMGNVHIIEHCIPTIFDKSMVPDEFKDINMARVKKAWSEGRKTIPGIKFEITKTTKRTGGVKL